ncbi:hypothetical protein AO382_0194 [Moraxella catarrhalis]|nr:hypothetical protein AO382_0194 [Moraxella catarrhalis]
MGERNLKDLFEEGMNDDMCKSNKNQQKRFEFYPNIKL